jgi:hypothetical protein
MEEVDKNISLVSNQDIVNLKNALTIDNTVGQGSIHDEIISEEEKDYIVEHYTQMSTVNRNILNMFLYSGASNWTTLLANTPIKITKDYMIIRYTGTGSFPKLIVHKTNAYTYNSPINSIDVRAKPLRITNDYYVLHRTDNSFSNLYNYSFDKNVSYIMI